MQGMQHLPVVQPGVSSPQKTNGGEAWPNSSERSKAKPMNVIWAEKAVLRLFRLLPPQDVGSPEHFQTAVVQIFSHYPPRVLRDAVDAYRGIPGRTSRPTLDFIKKVCDELYEPILREQERTAAQLAAERTRLLAPPRRERTPEEQAAINAQVERARKMLGIPACGLPPKSTPAQIDWGDGRHAERVRADLEERRRRKDPAKG